MSEFKLLPDDRPNYTAKVLKAVAATTIVAGAVAAPNLLQLLSLNLGRKAEKEKMLRAVREARRRGWLTFRENKKGVEVGLSASGRLKWQKINMSAPLYRRKWDKKWRMIIFDIPTQKRVNAHKFRSAIKKLGFKQFQRSVWVCPYPCVPQIAYFRQTYNVKDHVRIFEATAIDDETSLKYLFGLK